MVTFDEVKRQANLKKHGYDFIGIEAVFEGFTITREDARDAYGELRLQTLGLLNGTVVFVVHTTRGNADLFKQGKNTFLLTTSSIWVGLWLNLRTMYKAKVGLLQVLS